MRHARQVAVATLSLLLLLGHASAQERLGRRILVFRVAHSQATHFSVSCGPADEKTSANLVIVLTAIDRRPPKPNSIVTVTVDGAQTRLRTNQRGVFQWNSTEFKSKVALLLDRLRAAESMTLEFAGVPAVTFDLDGAWLGSPRACTDGGEPEKVAMFAAPDSPGKP